MDGDLLWEWNRYDSRPDINDEDYEEFSERDAEEYYYDLHEDDYKL